MDVLGSIDRREELSGETLGIQRFQGGDRQGEGGGRVVLEQVQQVLPKLPQAVCPVQLDHTGAHVTREVRYLAKIE